MEEFLSQRCNPLAGFVPPMSMCNSEKVRTEFRDSAYVWIRHQYEGDFTVELVPRSALLFRSDVSSSDGSYVDCPCVTPAPFIEEIIAKCRVLGLKTIAVSENSWKMDGEMKSLLVSDRNMATALLSYWNMMTSK